MVNGGLNEIKFNFYHNDEKICLNKPVNINNNN